MQRTPNNIMDQFRHYYKSSDILNKLIIVNVAVFMAVHVVNLIFMLFDIPHQLSPLVRWLAVPAFGPDLLTHPWTLITYMFLHEGIFHILFNMLFLFWFGQLFLREFRQKNLLGVYLLAGLSGALTYVLAYNIFPVFDQHRYNAIALGASASVMGVVLAIAAYKPNYKLNLLFIGPVKIIYIALVAIALDIVQMPRGNAGGHLAHIGGAALGYFYALRMQKGVDITKGVNNLIDRLVGLFPSRRLHVSHKKSTYQWRNARKMDDYEYNKSQADTQQRIDEILDKISKNGYDALTKEEKEFLFRQKK